MTGVVSLSSRYYYSEKSSCVAQISWHGRPAREHGQDGRATSGCRTAALWAPAKSARPRTNRLALAALAAIVSLVLFAVASPAAEVETETCPQRVQIHKSIEVDGETIRLSDLLPPDAPAELSELAARVVLGDSPLPASQRVISKAQVEQKLREFPSLLEQLELPDRLIVTCKRRRLSSAEIWTAIEDFLLEQGLPDLVPQACWAPDADGASTMVPEAAEPGTEDCAAGGLQLQAPVFVTKLDPGLEVKSMEPDRLRRRLQFLLWTAHEPQVLPFYVTIEELSNGVAWKSQLSKSARPARTPPVILVSAGKPATLVVETATLRLTTRVSPLESGVQGQVIRVRNLDTQRVFAAQVVGEGLLQAELAASEE